jgi:excisionase family DNA binding protein
MFSIAELVKKLNISEKTIRRWIKNNQISVIKMGRDYRISETEVDRIVSCGVSLKVCSLSIPKKAPMRRRKEGIRPWERN